MNAQTVKLVQALSAMETTDVIAQELDKVLSEIGATDGSTHELVAVVILAMTRCGKGTITMEGTN